MNTDLIKRLNFVFGLISLLTGCVFLILFTIQIQNMTVSIESIVGLICGLTVIVGLFFISANSFIKYGIAQGIDYALEQQKQ